MYKEINCDCLILFQLMFFAHYCRSVAGDQVDERSRNQATKHSVTYEPPVTGH